MALAYYNEIDPFAAAWLRELIAAGHIAPGVVDQRSIEDVQPDELVRYTQCHFFAGIGVWSYALRNAGWSDDRPIWTGSCPCQPFSAAGKGAGFADERHLWPAFLHLIRECRPPVVAGEQVASKDGLAWLDLVSTDLEGENYAFGATDMCAAGVGAPHIRQRSYWVAHTSSSRSLSSAQPGIHSCEESAGSRDGELERSCATDWLANTNAGKSQQFEGQGAMSDEAKRGRACGEPSRCSNIGRLDHDHDPRPQGHAGYVGAAGGREEQERPASEASVSGGLALSRSIGREWGEGAAQGSVDNGAVAGRVQSNDGFARDNETSLIGHNRHPGPVNGFWEDADWLFCRDGKWRSARSGTFPLVNGASARVGRLRGYGNAIVAQVAQAFIESVMEDI